MKLPDRTDIYAQCRKCDECIAARRRHWIGRLLAEEKTSDHVWFVTLTYGGGYDNKKAYWLEYSDVQKTLKKLRKAGYRFKYVAVGEYGTSKDRAHWHLLIYFQGDTPKVKMDARIHWEFWDHGYAQIEKPRSNQGAAVYIMDYMNKDNLARGLIKYSKRPMLGQEYLVEYAREHARKGLALFVESDRFTIHGSRPNRKGQPFYYPVGRDTGIYEKMMNAYLLEWAETRPNQRLRLSEDLIEWLEGVNEDLHEFPKPVQELIARHYGFEAIAGEVLENDLIHIKEWSNQVVQDLETKRTEKTVRYHLAENAWLEINDFSALICVQNLEGEGKWQKHLGKHGQDHHELTETLLALALQAVESGPSRLTGLAPDLLQALRRKGPPKKPEKKLQKSQA